MPSTKDKRSSRASSSSRRKSRPKNNDEDDQNNNDDSEMESVSHNVDDDDDNDDGISKSTKSSSTRKKKKNPSSSKRKSKTRQGEDDDDGDVQPPSKAKKSSSRRKKGRESKTSTSSRDASDDSDNISGASKGSRKNDGKKQQPIRRMSSTHTATRVTMTGEVLDSRAPDTDDTTSTHQSYMHQRSYEEEEHDERNQPFILKPPRANHRQSTRGYDVDFAYYQSEGGNPYSHGSNLNFAGMSDHEDGEDNDYDDNEQVDHEQLDKVEDPSSSSDSSDDSSSSSDSGSSSSSATSGDNAQDDDDDDTISASDIGALFSTSIHTDYDDPKAPKSRPSQRQSQFSFSSFSQVTDDESKKFLMQFVTPLPSTNDVNINLPSHLAAPAVVARKSSVNHKRAPLADLDEETSEQFKDQDESEQLSAGYPDDDAAAYPVRDEEDLDDDDSVEKHLDTAGVYDVTERQDRTMQSEEAPSSLSLGTPKVPPQTRSAHTRKGAFHEEKDGDMYDYKVDQDLEEAERVQRRKRFFEIVFAVACCCCLLVVAIVVAIFFVTRGGDDDNDSASGENTNSTPLPTRAPVFFVDDVDDDFLYEPLLTVQPIIISEMPPSEGNCDNVDGSRFSNILDQCACEGSIVTLPDDVVRMHEALSEVILPTFYGKLNAGAPEDIEMTIAYTEDITSCAPSNLAMIWLSTGEMRSSGYLRQRFALAIAYYATQGLWDKKWDYSDGWLTQLDECLWLGVQCNNQDVVNSVALDTNNLFGTFPSEISKLDGLAALSLSRNQLSGEFPTEIYGMPRLRELRLYANRLQGRLATEIGLASSLQSLQLQTNFYAARLPTEIGLLVKLTELDLGFNNFRNIIPSELGNLSLLRLLTLTENKFSGPFSTDLGRMTSLQNVTLSRNSGLIGDIPTTFGNMKDLVELKIVDTGMGGFLPSEMGQLSNLYDLELKNGNFRGQIPPEWGGMTGLHYLTMTGNSNAAGPLPNELGLLTNLIRLLLSDNGWTGTLPASLGSLRQLEVLTLQQTGLQGTVADEVCALRSLGKLDSFSVPCPSDGFECVIPQCCTRCLSY